MTRAEILNLQRDLAARGYPLKADGIYGPKTAAAYQDWLNQHTPQDVITPAPAAAKPWYLSRAIIGILVSAVAIFAERMGWMVDSNDLTVLVMQLLEVGGLALAFIGTVRRRAPIDSGLVAPSVRLPTRASQVRAERDGDKPSGPFGF